MKHQLCTHPLFKTPTNLLSHEDSIAVSYKRARLMSQAHPLTARDVRLCTTKFWDMWRDPICAVDPAATTILACHVNLAIGTLSRHLKNRPDLKPLVDQLLRFEVLGIYLLTERGHGLDAPNLETTATKTPHGFILNTPREEAAKFMPGTSPRFNIPKVAITMARLIIDGEDHGPRFFIVPICNEREMYKGVESVALGTRSGTQPFDWSMTRFNNVHLPSTALVTSDIHDLSKPQVPDMAWWYEIWRVPIGGLAVTAPIIPSLKTAAYIGGRYSMHRCILDKKNGLVPILTFRTQQWPMVQSVATAMVLDAWFPVVLDSFLDNALDYNVRHALSIIAKTTICRHHQRCVPEVGERCGAQGTFEHNYMARTESDAKGPIIAEGDIVTLSIRLFSELLLGRYEVPLPVPEESLLARHASALLEENTQLLQTLKGNHRSESFNNLILPQSQFVVEAIGHALAYSAALKAGLPKYVLDVYESSVIRQDPAWYSECAGMNRLEQRRKEDAAVTSMLPHLSTLLEQLEISDYINAPIVSDARWKEFVGQLTVYRGNAVPSFDKIQAML